MCIRDRAYTLADGTKYVASVFGLSGSGKSTLTHAKHDGKYGVTVLHDCLLYTSRCV